jgi:MoxR-like ATPase
MFPQEITTTLTSLFKQSHRSIVVFLQGPPGMGKTAVIGQAAQQASKELRTFALPTCESVDLRGLPTIEKGSTIWASPLPRTGQGVLLLDELSSAAPDVQVAAHHLVHAEAAHGSVRRKNYFGGYRRWHRKHQKLNTVQE